MKKFRSSKISRLTGLGKAVTKAGTQLLIDKLESSQSVENIRKIKATKEIVESMGELKGAVMKLGQMLSITEDLALPEEVVTVFKKLQSNAPTVPYEQMKNEIKKELGQNPEELFKFFEKTPIASASIGQVYKAITKDDKEIVLKVQYPNIEEAIKSDLANLDKLTKLFKIIFPNTPNIKPILEELSQSIIEECNYESEFENILLLKKTFFSHKNIHFQTPLEEFSTRRIIASEFIQGDHYDQTKAYPQDVKNSLGTSFYEFHLDQLFQSKLMHTDPQNGNYIFNQDQIYILDCGSIKRFDTDFVMAYALLTHSLRKENKNLFIKALVFLGVIQPDDNNELIDQFFNTAKRIYLPYTKEGVYAPDKFNPVQLISGLIDGVRSLKNRPTPHEDFLMLDRSNIGIFTKLRSWQSKIDWQEGIVKYQSPTEEEAIKFFKIK